MAQYMGLLDIDDDLWEWHQNIVLRHAYLALQVGGKAMVETGGGTMTFVASVSGIVGAAARRLRRGEGRPHVARALGRGRARPPRAAGQRAVAPGMVWTPRASAYVGEEGRNKNIENAPLRRVALPEDIAARCSSSARTCPSYVNGQTLVVDGGVGVKFPYPWTSDDHLDPETLAAAHDLTGRVAVVTGRRQWHRLASALRLAEAGATVVRRPERGRRAGHARPHPPRGGWPTPWPVDVTDREAVDALVAGAVERHGRLDVMANIAGIILTNPVVDISEDEFDRSWA